MFGILCWGVVSVHAEPPEAAKTWRELCGKFGGQAEFAWVENDKGLPNVLIYGDSISIQYHQELLRELKGAANLYRIFTNGGDSGTVIEKMDLMDKTMRNANLEGRWDFQWDLIQLNVGLHDLKYWKDGKMDRKSGKQVTSLADYEENLREIIPYLEEKAPGAALVFAMTTPVPEKSSGRDAGDAARYNEVAHKVLEEFPKVVVNDLYELTKPHQRDWWVKPGNVHFNSKGQKAQAGRTAEIILQVLKERSEKSQ